MSTVDMATEQERVGRLRKLLEPLAVLYEKAALKASKEPFEITLVVHEGTDHARENSHGGETVHIINGELLQAAYEAWQEYRRIERELLEQSRPPMSDQEAGGDAVEILAPNVTVLKKKQENYNEDEQVPGGLSFLSAPERAWLEWFYSSSEVDQKFVELCGEKDILVTPANIDQMKKIVKE